MSNQYSLDFSSRTNERCAIIGRLRGVCLPSMTMGRLEGVIELLQRLTVYCRDLPQADDEPYSVQCLVADIGTGIKTRRHVSERTVRRWISDSIELGLLEVDYLSHQRGGSRWNVFTVNFAAIRGLISGCQVVKSVAKLGGHGRTRADMMTAPGADTVSAPRGGQNVRPYTCITSTQLAGLASQPADALPKIQEHEEPKIDPDCPVSAIAAQLRDNGVFANLADSLSRSLVAQGWTLNQVGSVLRDWHANRVKFVKPIGALVHRLREGDWPTDDVVAADEQSRQASARADANRRRMRDRLYGEICHEWRRSGRWANATESEIDAEIELRISKWRDLHPGNLRR